jgi:hypothetical protein
MSGHGRPPLCKPGHASRARCARGAVNPGLLEPTSWARQQNDGGKGGKGGNLESLGNGPFPTTARSGGNWRKSPAGLCSRNRPQFCCLTNGVQSLG